MHLQILFNNHQLLAQLLINSFHHLISFLQFLIAPPKAHNRVIRVAMFKKNSLCIPIFFRTFVLLNFSNINFKSFPDHCPPLDQKPCAFQSPHLDQNEVAASFGEEAFLKTLSAHLFILSIFCSYGRFKQVLSVLHRRALLNKINNYNQFTQIERLWRRKDCYIIMTYDHACDW